MLQISYKSAVYISSPSTNTDDTSKTCLRRRCSLDVALASDRVEGEPISSEEAVLKGSTAHELMWWTETSSGESSAPITC